MKRIPIWALSLAVSLLFGSYVPATLAQCQNQGCSYDG